MIQHNTTQHNTQHTHNTTKTQHNHNTTQINETTKIPPERSLCFKKHPASFRTQSFLVSLETAHIEGSLP